MGFCIGVHDKDLVVFNVILLGKSKASYFMATKRICGMYECVPSHGYTINQVFFGDGIFVESASDVVCRNKVGVIPYGLFQCVHKQIIIKPCEWKCFSGFSIVAKGEFELRYILRTTKNGSRWLSV